MSKFNRSIYYRNNTNILMGVYLILDGLTSILTLGRCTSNFSIDYSSKRLLEDMKRRKRLRGEK